MQAPSKMGRRGIVAGLGSAAISHRRLVAAGWLAALLLALGGASAVGTRYSTSFSLPGTDSQRAADLLRRGSSLGLIVAVFQWGWLRGVFGVTPGPVEAWLPVMLFAIFGLSVDDEVFLVSRVHEGWIRRRDASAAVTTGLSSTGRVITAAATIMVLVFLWFVLIHERIAQEFGLSLAGAVFLDAFVVCGLLLPAVLELIGAATWKLPHRIERRLPKVAIEPDPLEEPNPRSARPAFREAPRPILVASSRPAPRDWARCGHGDRFCDADL